MNETLPPPDTHRIGKAAALALRLADAENALHALTSGQVDAIIDPSGRTYLLRPAQEFLRENERRLQTILESTADVITVVGRSGIILSQHGAVMPVLGYEPEELEGSVLFKLIHNTDVPSVYSAFVSVIEGFDEHATARFRHLTRDGSYVLVEASLRKVRDFTRESAVFVLRLVTGNPGLTGSTQTVVTASLPPGTVRVLAKPTSHPPALPGTDAFQTIARMDGSLPALEMIQGNLELQSLLPANPNDVPAVGQYEVRLQFASIDAQGDVRLVLSVGMSKLAATQIEVLIDLQNSDWLAFADPLGFQQAMWSLIKNTVASSTLDGGPAKASAKGATDSLNAGFARRGDHVEPELLPVVFGSLQHGDAAMRQLYDSLRFGLFIAKGVAEAQRGALTMANEASGQSTPFRLHFKIAPTSVA